MPEFPLPQPRRCLWLRDVVNTGAPAAPRRLAALAQLNARKGAEDGEDGNNYASLSVENGAGTGTTIGTLSSAALGVFEANTTYTLTVSEATDTPASNRVAAIGLSADGVVVGSTATGAPFSFLDVKTNRLTGAMIDIAHAVAAKAVLEVRIETTTFAALVPSLTARKIDIVAAGILRTPEREKVVAFCAVDTIML